MTREEDVLKRMCDVAFALLVADSSGIALSRIQLQKFIYLVDSLRPLYLLLPQKAGYVTYKRGPYDQAVQNAVDVLAFRGFVQIVELKVFSDKRTASTYALSSVGRGWTTKIAEDPAFAREWAVAAAIGKRLTLERWQNIVQLVYSEPAYLSARAFGFGRPLDSTNGLAPSTTFLMATMQEALSAGFSGSVITEDLLVDLFFDFLEVFARGSGIQRE